MTTRRLAVTAGLVAAYVLAIGSLVVRAPLWNDELYTWYVAQQPTLGDVWDALETGVEQIPPFYYVVTRVSLAVFGDNQVALRIPSLVGFLLACSCLFAVVARRTSAWYGLVAALVPLAGGAAPYAWEARPYALVLGFAAAAVLCHQLRADGLRPGLAVIGLALALAAATAVHYYGALVVLPIALAEAVRWRMRQKLDRAVVVALFAPVVPLAISIPLLQEARRYAGAFWTEFDLASAPEFFVFLLRAEVFSASRIPDWLGIGFAALVLGGALVVLLRRPRATQLEVAAAIGFLLLPLVGVIVGEIATGAYVERYVLSAVLGPALLVPLALHRLADGRPRAAIGAAALLTVWFGVLFQYWHRDVGVDLDRMDRLEAFIEDHALALGLPVAVAHPHDYLELAHDAPRPVAARLIRLSDPARSERYTDSRSTEDGLVVLAGFAPLKLVTYEEQRRPFLLLRTVRGEADDWIDRALADDGARTQAVARDDADGFTLVRVEPVGSP
jgi:4-amino-4-deoxy-L-arabinose transferase-like glycosyltransferase